MTSPEPTGTTTTSEQPPPPPASEPEPTTSTSEPVVDAGPRVGSLVLRTFPDDDGADGVPAVVLRVYDGGRVDLHELHPTLAHTTSWRPL